MSEVERGPVELVAVGFTGTDLPAEVVHALKRVPRTVATLLDVVIISRLGDGSFTFAEYEDHRTRNSLPELELEAIGLAAEEDALELAEDIETGDSALIVAYEVNWVRELAAAFAPVGGVVIAETRIPAAVVNELADLAKSQD